MARQIEFTQSQILEAAFKIVKTEGFPQLTAKNIAAALDCSTQPIYKAFPKIELLKEELFYKFRDYMKKRMYLKTYTGKSAIDLGLNYIHFAQDEKELYHRLFMEDFSKDGSLYCYSYLIYQEFLQKDPAYQNVSPAELKNIHTGTWVAITGLAYLMSTNRIHLSDEEIIAYLKESFDMKKED